MKILMLGWELPPHFIGGMGVVCYHLCKSLAESGADIEFILPFDAEFDIDFMKINSVNGTTYKDLVNIDYGVYGRAVSSTTSLPIRKQVSKVEGGFLNKVSKVSSLGEFDVIHAHDWMTFRAGLLAKQITGSPLIVHVHATEFDRSAGNSGNEMIHEIEYLGMSMADKVIAISQRVKDSLIDRYSIDPDKIEIVHNSIDVSSGHLAAKDSETVNSFRYLEEMKKQGYRIVSNIGRMTMQKGLTHLLEAAKLALEKNPKIIFLLVGSGDQREELIMMAADLGIAQNVVFINFLNGKKLRDAFRVGDLFVMPSVSEPFGLTVLESIGLGTPALLTHQSGVGEILHNVLKVDFWDTRAMADKIVAVTKSDSLRDELAVNSYREFTHQSWSHSAEKTIGVYSKAMGVSV